MWFDVTHGEKTVTATRYYAANAVGRLLGIILSDLLYQLAGIEGCLIGSASMLLLCLIITFLLPVAPERLGLQQTAV
jgi:hypothetical protein